jgi:hypothetical protein
LTNPVRADQNPVAGADDAVGSIMYFDIAYADCLVIQGVLLWVFTVEAFLKNVANTPK